jgi:hypothetical protein
MPGHRPSIPDKGGAKRRPISKARAIQLVKKWQREGDWTYAAMADELGVHLRTAKSYGAEAKNLPDRPDEVIDALPEPIPFSELAPNLQWTLEDTPEGYRRWNDRFFEDKMPAHIFAFVQSAYEYGGRCERTLPSVAREAAATGGGGPEVAVVDSGVGDAGGHCGSPAAYRSPHGYLCSDCYLGYRALGGTGDLVGRWKLRLILNVPPGHAKTTYFTVRWACWRLCQNRDWRIGVISLTDVIAKTWVGEIAAQLEDPDGLPRHFGRFQAEKNWSPAGGQIRIEGCKAPLKDRSVFARGVTTQINGLRFDEIVGDDMIDDDTCLTEERREKAYNQYARTSVTRLAPNGLTRVVGTRWHRYDIYNSLSELKDYLTDEPLYEHINFPAVLDWETKEVLWPDYWPYEKLMSEKMSVLKSNGFELVFQQNPLPPDAMLIRGDWIYGRETDPDPNKGCLDRNRVAGEIDLEPGWVRVMSVDPGVSKYWAIIVMDVREANVQNPQFDAKILWIERGKWDSNQGKRKMIDIVRRFRPRIAILEVNSQNKYFHEDLEWRQAVRETRTSVIPHTTHRNKSDPGFGVESLAGDFEAGSIRIPYAHDGETQKQARWLIDEAVEYPFAPTDDVMMALWFPKPNLLSLRSRGALGTGKTMAFRVPPRLHKRAWAGVPA